MCVLACVSQRWEPQQCQVNTTSARRFTGNYRKQAWCERADWTPRCSSRDPAQARRLGPDGAHTDPHKRQPSSPPAWLQRSLTSSSLSMKPTEAMGAGGRGYGCEPPGTTPPHSTHHKLEGRTERAGGGRCCGWTPGSFFPSLFHLFSLSLCQSRCPFRPSLSHPPSFLLRFLFTHTFTNVQLTNIPALIHHSLSFIGQLEAHTLPHTPTHWQVVFLLPCRCLALRLLFKFSFLSEPTSMCAWMPWYHHRDRVPPTFLPSFHPCQTNRRVYVLTSCSQREQHAFCLRLFLPLTFRGRLNESVSIVWKRR